MFEAGAGQLQKGRDREAHLKSVLVFAAQVGLEHGGVVGGQSDRDSPADEYWQGMVRQSCIGAAQLAGEGAGAEVARRADFEGDVAFLEQVHKRGVMDCGDAVTDALGAEVIDGIADLLGTADFASVDEPMQAARGGVVVHFTKISSGDGELVSSHAEGDHACVVEGGGDVRDLHGRGGAELAHGVEDPANARKRFLGMSGSAHRDEVRFHILQAQEHDAGRDSDLGIADVLGAEGFAQAADDKCVVIGRAQERSHPLEGLEKAGEIGVFVAGGDFLGSQLQAVARGQFARGVRRNGTLGVEVKFYQRNLAEGFRPFCHLEINYAAEPGARHWSRR